MVIKEIIMIALMIVLIVTYVTGKNYQKTEIVIITNKKIVKNDTHKRTYSYDPGKRRNTKRRDD